MCEEIQTAPGISFLYEPGEKLPQDIIFHQRSRPVGVRWFFLHGIPEESRRMATGHERRYCPKHPRKGAPQG